MSQDNNEIIKKAQSGDMQAFESLLKIYDRQVMNIAYSFRNSEDDARDIYQEVFLRVFRGLKGFKFNSEFSTWLFRITTNVCITYQRKNARHVHESLDREISQNDDDTAKLSDFISGDNTTDSSVINSELSGHIQMAVNELPPQQKLAFTLKHYEGYKIREISEMLNCAEGTVKRYLFTATNKLREKLKDIIE
jgi:RNA polymerase sigma-70 factor (ECF subfamily)